MSSTKLSASERKQIILDHLQGIPNNLYEVKELANGTYRVSKKATTDESITKESPPKPKNNKKAITNEDIMNRITELYEMQNNTPQSRSYDIEKPRPPIDSTIEEETIKTIQSPQRPTIGRRKLILH